MRIASLRLGQLRLIGALALGQIIGRGALALGLLLLVRELDAGSFGTLALALAVVAILATLADAGFARLLVRDAARAGLDVRSLVYELLRWRLLAVAAVAGLASSAVAVGATPFEPGLGALVVLYLVFESVAFGYENAAAGAERPWRFVVAQAIAAIALLGGLAALTATDSVSLSTAMAVLAGASALKVCGHLLAWRGSSATGEPPRRRERPTTLFLQALPFLGLMILTTVYYRVGIVALYAVGGATETASYAAAIRLVDVVGVAVSVGFLGISPTLSRMHRDRPEQIWVTWRRMIVTVGAVALPVAAVVAIWAEPICGTLFGARYGRSAAADLRLLLPGVVLLVVQGVNAAIVFMADDHRAILKISGINLTVCVAASVVLSEIHGSRGTAVAFSLAEAFSFVTFALLIRRRHGAPRLAGAGRPSRRRPPA